MARVTKFSPEVQERAVRMVLEHASVYTRRAAAARVTPPAKRGP